MDKKKVKKPKVKKPKVKKPKVPKPKVKKPKVKKPKVPKSNVKNPKVKKSKIQQKGGADNIGNTTVGLFKSFFAFGKDIFTEIDLLTKTPGQLGKIAN
jgi:hypothetical protein